jgi:hypothetical protein
MKDVLDVCDRHPERPAIETEQLEVPQVDVTLEKIRSQLRQAGATDQIDGQSPALRGDGQQSPTDQPDPGRFKRSLLELIRQEPTDPSLTLCHDHLIGEDALAASPDPFSV